MTESVKIAQISDLHFAEWDWHLSQFFSKRWLGNANFLFGRRRDFAHDRLGLLPDLFKQEGVSHVIISGDLTTTTSLGELEKAKRFIDQLKERGLTVLSIPGNHDQYTRRAYREQLFYNYVDSNWDLFDLKKDGITVQRLSRRWSIVGIDSALATPWFCSSGRFSENSEKRLTDYLQSLPSDEFVIVVNHFPFFHQDSPRNRLERSDDLKQLLEKFPQVKVYCHGHTHRQCMADLRASNLPIILNSGCTPHRTLGFWHLLEASETSFSAEAFGWKENGWSPVRKERYELV